MLKRVLVRVICLSGPATLLAGFAVYQLNKWLLAKFQIEVHPLLYAGVLFTAMWAALWVASKGLIDELSAKAKKSKER